ncbi:MAG: hypothetical protein COB49_04665 [Alphaproteobacteria bacterium]|nr:MAG: hypothetical protein COB49_04665 [Alphaproteobacteria bacterium]
MKDMSINKLHNRQIAEEAANWAVLLDAKALTKQDKKELAQWLSESSLHVDELLLSASIMIGFGKVDAHKNISIDALLKEAAPEVVPLFKEFAKKGSNASLLRRYVGQIAAIFLIAIISGLYFFTAPTQDHNAFITKTGEQRSLTLTDGSIIHVNTETDIRIEYLEKERRVQILRGEAMFEVAHDTTRPFRVYSGGTITQAVGTIFNVQHIGGTTRVSVLEGSVFVQIIDETKITNKHKHLISEGNLAAIAQNGKITDVTNPNMQAISAWRMRKLVFKSDTLATISVEFNRYNYEKIYVDDRIAASLQFSGVFNADDPHSFIKYLEVSNAVNINRSKQHEFHLTSHSNPVILETKITE